MNNIIKTLKKNHIYKNNGKKKYIYKEPNTIIGIYVVKNLTLKSKNIKMLKFFLKKKFKKIGTIFFKSFLNLNNSKKPLETRMGKGKGPIFDQLVYLRKNSLIFLIKKKKKYFKLYIKTNIIKIKL